ncbi:hypothetical protein RR48_12484 [Papilio machaon]|uniref:Uncharacterized protein n=1 Tax=Papilio machaon TaxID=76193 RepID=A0A194RMC0_PAPMA|nr:hypothetical protein RR48_12484 [Papilio machaon]
MSRVATLRSNCSGRGGGGDSEACGVRRAAVSVARARAARRETDSLAMRAAATSTGSGQLGARRQKTDLHVAEPTTSARSASPAPSLRSQRARQYRASLPVRTARLLQRSRTATPAESEGSASPAPAPSSLLQDVVDIKTLLLQLKRVLQESETLDPLLAACAESPARGNGRRPPAAALPPDAAAEMRRQILYLQSQLEERDRLVRVLQQQMLRMAESHEPRSDDTVNVATQTDRLRPPMSTALTSSENSGLVSWNEQSSARKLPSYSEAQKTKRPVTNGTVKCQCGARKVNGVTEEDGHTDRQTAVLIKTNSRVGSKYLQALAKSSDSKRYTKRDSSLGDKNDRKTLYTSRSRSIENFSRQSVEPFKSTITDESTLKHHTSYGDLYNGRISSKESVNGNRHSPSLNGQSTDTDYSSDGGYKSLPSSINYGQSPKKVSGIPRRSLDHKFLTNKQVKASAV